MLREYSSFASSSASCVPCICHPLLFLRTGLNPKFLSPEGWGPCIQEELSELSFCASSRGPGDTERILGRISPQELLVWWQIRQRFRPSPQPPVARSSLGLWREIRANSPEEVVQAGVETRVWQVGQCR